MSGKGKYFDGKRPISISVSWEIKDNSIVIYNEETGSRLPSWSLEDLAQDLDQNAAIVLFNKTTGERLEIIGSSNELPNELITRQKVVFRPKKFIALIISLIVILIGLWQSLPYLSKWASHFISEETERKWAQQLKINEMHNFKYCRPSKEAQAAWKTLLAKTYPLNQHEKENPLEIQFVNLDAINAMTFPGGRILIFRGLLENASSPEELSGVLFHEIGHVKKRHIIQKIISALTLSMTFQFISGDFSSLFAIDPSTALGLAALTFDRGMEREADEFAYQRLLTLNIDPKKTASFFEKGVGMPDKYAFLSTHPGDKERVKFFNRAPVKKYAPILNESEWKALKGYCSK